MHALCFSEMFENKKMTRNGEQYAYANNASQTAATAIAVLTIIVFQAPFRD